MLDFTRKHEFLVGIDSDGCAFDTMELKHKECFIPQIINHYGLDLTNPDAQTFLFDNIKGFLFGEVPNLAEIDTSKEGSVKW